MAWLTSDTSIARGDDIVEDCSQMKIAGNGATPQVCCLCTDRATSVPKLKKQTEF